MFHLHVYDLGRVDDGDWEFRSVGQRGAYQAKCVLINQVKVDMIVIDVLV
jgi:hypothetical protein